MYAMPIGRTTGVKRSLISSMHTKGIVILTLLFQEYIKLGLKCTNIEWVLEYNPQPVFQWFVQKIAHDKRRQIWIHTLLFLGNFQKLLVMHKQKRT